MDVREQTVCFTGHRIFYHDIVFVKSSLAETLDGLVQKGYRRFLAGGALGFDTLAASAVLELRDRFPSISLMLALPCEGQQTRWRADQRARYERILSLADEVTVLNEHYVKGCMHERNRYLVDNSGLCLCYLVKRGGGTYYTVQYAKKQGLPVINLAGRETGEDT